MLEGFGPEDIAAMREEGDLPAFLRLRIRPDRTPVQTAALWQQCAAPARHTVGAWPSATPLQAGRRRAPGEAAFCDCSRCRALGAPCAADPCRCPCAARPGEAGSRMRASSDRIRGSTACTRDNFLVWPQRGKRFT